MKRSTLGGAVLALLCLIVSGSSRALAQPYKDNEIICVGVNIIPDPIPTCGTSDNVCNQDSDCLPGHFTTRCFEQKAQRYIAIARSCQVDDTTIDRFRMLVSEDPGICEPGTRVACGISYGLGLIFPPETIAFAGESMVPADTTQRNIMVYCGCTSQ